MAEPKLERFSRWSNGVPRWSLNNKKGSTYSPFIVQRATVKIQGPPLDHRENCRDHRWTTVLNLTAMRQYGYLSRSCCWPATLFRKSNPKRTPKNPKGTNITKGPPKRPLNTPERTRNHPKRPQKLIKYPKMTRKS